MTYWGLSLNTSNLGIDHYAAFGLAGGVETVAFAVVLLLVERTGRRWLLSLSCLAGGAALLFTHAVPQGKNLEFQLSSPFLPFLALLITNHEGDRTNPPKTLAFCFSKRYFYCICYTFIYVYII